MANKIGRVSISQYISQNFTKSFLTIFLPLFFIGSLVSIVQLSSLTKYIQIDFWEMAKLYGYNLPAMLFYTIPVSFLIAVTTVLLRLSNDNELISLFALGVKSKYIIRRLLVASVLFSILLLTLSLIKMPQTKQQLRAFKIYKTAQAKFNISPSQLGQKFGDFFVYIEGKNGNNMENVVIYTKEQKTSNRLFIAKNAQVNNSSSIVSLKLYNGGSGYTFSKDSLKMVDYDTMEIYQNLKPKSFSYQNVKEYWEKLSKVPKKRGKILFFIFISLIPIIALYIVSAFSIINPRYQKSYAYPALGITIILLYIIAIAIQKQGSIALLVGSLISITIIGLILFQYKVAKYF